MSLYLSFTTAQSQLGENFSGMKDDEIYLLETLLSVHEGGQWVADLNLPRSFPYNNPYVCLPGLNNHDVKTDYISDDISCIDNRAELLEPPEATMGIVRACGDWQARLATCAVALALKWHVLLLLSNICWKCVGDAMREGNINILIA